jgi:endonuclease/exonuclease/phosphatase family metal-dependent hydrolase
MTYLLAVCALAGFLTLQADRWWAATLIMFSPRIVWGLPLVVLAPFSLACHRRLLVPLGLSAIVWFFFILNFSFAGMMPRGADPTKRSLRLMTCNGDSSALDPLRFKQLVATTQPDVIALQDVRSSTVAAALDSGNWHIESGNGLVVASRFSVQPEEIGHQQGITDVTEFCQAAKVSTPIGQVRLFNLHLASPRSALLAALGRSREGRDALDANSKLRERQSLAIREWVDRSPDSTLILGDFNTPIESRTYREAWRGYANAFSFAGWGVGNTHFTRRTGVRIDHILVSQEFVVLNCWVGPDVGSAHRPVLTDVQLRN